MKTALKVLAVTILLFSVFDAWSQPLIKGLFEPKSFEDLVGETITIKLPNQHSYSNFYWEVPDTIWIKKVKKPVLNKHYRLQIKPYHCEESRSGQDTPASYLHNQKFEVLNVEQKEDSNLESWNGHYTAITTITLHLQSISNGDRLFWELKHIARNYADNTGDNGGIDIVVDRLSDLAYNRLPFKDCYYAAARVASVDEYKPLHFDSAEYTISTTFYYKPEIRSTVYLLGTINGASPVKLQDKDLNVISNDAYSQRVEERQKYLANAGHYSAQLTHVQKPANSKIQRGKITTEELEDRYIYMDNYLSLAMGALEKNIVFVLQNKTDYSMKILWDEASFIKPGGSAQRVIHNGVRFAEKSQPQAPSIVPGHASLNDAVVPVDNVRYSSVASDWIIDPLLPKMKTNGTYAPNTTFSLLLPIQISGVTNEYTFTFTLTWVYDNPSIREEYLKSHPE